MFSFVSLSWRGKPLESLEIIVSLIASTQTNTGLKIDARLDDQTYGRGVDVTDEQLATVNITRQAFHGDWNYTVHPAHTQSGACRRAPRRSRAGSRARPAVRSRGVAVASAMMPRWFPRRRSTPPTTVGSCHAARVGSC
jgi:hypothetical protein